MANNFSRAVQQVRDRRKVGQGDAYRERDPVHGTRQNPVQNPANAPYSTDWSSWDSQRPIRPATEPEAPATSGPAVLPTSSGVEQPELSAAQQESENKPTFASALLGIMGRGDTALNVEEGRALQESGEQAAEANRAPETVNWQGRDDLLKEYRRLRAAYDPANPEGEVNDRMQEVLRQLREGDEAAGNEARDYTWGDRATSVISGAAQNIGSSLANAASTVGQSYGRTAMMEQAGNMDQALRDIRFGENTSENVRAAMEAADEGNRAWEGLTATADRLGAAAAEDLERAKGGLSGLGRAGVDIAENVLEMGFDAAVGTVTGGGSLGSMFLRTLGSGAAEARNAGAGLDEQILYGTVKGGIEVATEKMFDGVAKIYGKGAADDIVENAIRKLSNNRTGRTFLRVLSNAGGEGVEELVSGLLEPVAQYIYKGELGDLDPSELLYGVLMGAAIGTLGGVTSIVTGQNANANARLQAMDTVEPNVNAIMSDPARLAEYAQQYQADTGEALPTGRGARNAIMQHEADALLAAQSGQQANAQPQTAQAQQSNAQSAQVLQDLMARPLNSEAVSRIVGDPAVRAEFERMFGVSLDNPFSARRIVQRLVPQWAEQNPALVEAARQADAATEAQEALAKWQEARDNFENMLRQPGGNANEADIRQNMAAWDATHPRPEVPEAPAAQTEARSEFNAQEAAQEAVPTPDNAETQPATPLAQTLLGQAQEGAEETQQTPLAQTLMGGQEAEEAPAQQAPAENAGVQNPVGTLNQRPTGSAPQRGTAESQTPYTVQNSPVTTEEMSQLIDQNREVGGYRYIPITNDATTQAAAERIQRDGWDGTLRAWSNDVHAGKTGAQLAATGALLYNNAVNSGNTSLALDILSDYTMLGRNTARGLQAMKIIQSLTPDARLYMIEKQVDQLSETLKNVPDGITIPQELKDAYRAAETEEARDQIVTQMQQAVAEQIPRTIGGFFTSLRYLNMLGNFRTQARNLIGNTLMAATTSAKNGVLYMLEGIASRATNGNYERSISLRVDPELRQAAMEEFKENPDFISGESRYSDNRSAADSFMQGVRDAQEPFGSRNPLVNALLSPLRVYNRATRFATEGGDRIFIGPRYARALAGYLQANGMDAATFRGIRDGSITPTAEQNAMLERARDFAMQEAQESTFHDSNQLSDWVSKIGRKPGTPSWARVLSEGLLPFRKTPANVAVRMFEYSPLGAIDTAIEAYRAGQADSDVDMNDVLNSAAKSLTGTGIFVLGMLMRAAGRLRGHEDDDKQSAFDQMRGQQDYSYVTANGDSYTIDWASPIAGTLFMGSQLYDLIQEGGFKLDDIGEIVTRMSDPMIQMSMLQGVKDTLDTLSNSDNSLGDVALNLALSYLSQAVSNSLFRQGERAYEDRRYSTFTTSDTRFGRTMQRQFGKWTTSVPRYDYNQVEYIDAWGRPDYNGSPLARGFENFLSPGYIGRNNSTEVDNELQRLYTAGQSNVFPQRIPMSYEVSQYDADGNRTGSRPLTPDEYVTFQRIAGQTSLEMVNDLMQSPAYASMSDEARGKAISEIYSYARNIAAQAVEPSTKKEYEAISTLSNPAAFIGIRAAYNSLTSSDTARDYDAIDRLMNNYASMPQDVRDLLEDKVSGLRKLAEAHRAGVDSATFFAQQDRIGDLKPAEGNTRVVTWQRVADIADNRELSDNQRDAMLRQEFTEGALKKYDECRNRGYTPTQIANFYRIYNTAGKKQQIIAQAISSGFSRPQAVALYSMWHNGRWS